MITGLTSTERRAALALGALFAFRMMGLFMILPVFALYAEQLPDSSPLLVGLALSAYGMTQALLQIPFGLWADRWGRKPVIAVGLVLFALGGGVAATATTLWGVLLGRALQGGGAISAAVLALLSDLTRPSHRSAAMAVVGMSIGASFAVSLLLGPALEPSLGVPGLFWLTTGMALLGLVLLFTLVPAAPPVPRAPFDRNAWREVIGNGALWRLNFGVFVLHLLITALFTVFPLVLRDQAGLVKEAHWQVYLPVLLLSAGLVFPMLRQVERRGLAGLALPVSALLLCLANLGFWLLPTQLWGLGFALFLFFLGFNLLEASLPAWLSRLAPPARKGAAMGVYATLQFLGAFVGGASAGLLQQHWGTSAVFLFCAVLTFFWALLSLRLPLHLPQIQPAASVSATT
jgi:MFS family permease